MAKRGIRGLLGAAAAIVALVVTGCSSTVDVKYVPDDPSDKSAQTMNLDELASSDFTSIEGVWSGKRSGTIKVDQGQVAWGVDGKEFSVVHGTRFVYLPAPDKPYPGGPLDVSENYVAMQWRAGFPAESAEPKEGDPPRSVTLVFYPAGKPMRIPDAFSIREALPSGVQDVLSSDESKDRILALPGAASGEITANDMQDFVMAKAPAKKQSAAGDGEKKASQNSAANLPQGRMDTAQLGGYNYSSIQGVWSGPRAGILSVHPTQIDWESDGELFAKIKGAKFLYGPGPTEEFSGGVQENNKNYVLMQWVSATSVEPHGSVLVFYPAGAPMVLPEVFGVNRVLPSDVSKDRILGLPGVGVGRLMPANYEPYIMTKITDTPNPVMAAPEASPCVAQVDGAYPCAGRGRPTEAQQLRTVVNGNGTLVTPTKNIGCDISPEGVSCLVNSWPESIKPDDYDENFGGATIIFLGNSGPALLGDRTDVPNYTGANQLPAGQPLEYGTVWYEGDFVFASDFKGLTVWNTRSGEGMFLNREGYRRLSKR
ncbi:hypothetical protein ACUH93_07880 [Dermabacteraceae bacterium P7006]